MAIPSAGTARPQQLDGPGSTEANTALVINEG